MNTEGTGESERGRERERERERERGPRLRPFLANKEKARLKKGPRAEYLLLEMERSIARMLHNVRKLVVGCEDECRQYFGFVTRWDEHGKQIPFTSNVADFLFYFCHVI